MWKRASRPVWFLDIDGALAPFDHRQPGLTGVQVGGWMGPMLTQPDVVGRIAGLHRARLVKVRWLTAWTDEAATRYAPAVGLPHFRVHREPEGAAVDGWWKEGVVRQFAERYPRRRFIWTDDQISEHSPAAVSGYGDRALFMPVDPAVGLTVGDVDAVEAFLKARAASGRGFSRGR